MCNFVPNECIAVAPRTMLEEKLPAWMLPGRLILIPLCLEEPGFTDELFPDFWIAHVVDIPDGLEVLVVSKLSAALSEAIYDHRAVVELNYLLPIANPIAFPEARSGQPEVGLVLSPPAQRLCERLRAFPGVGHSPIAGKIGMLDSGINPSMLRSGRSVAAYDYLPDTVAPLAPPPGGRPPDHDLLGHGTRVAGVLDAVLPDGVALASGRLCGHMDHTTVLRTTRAYMHLVSKEKPDVVNLSIGPKDDVLQCRHGHPVPAPAFYGNMLPFAFALASDRQGVVPVMAAGNDGRPCSARFNLPDTLPPIYAVATGSSGARAAYSNYVDFGGVPWLEAFGGDDEAEAEGMGMYRNDRGCRGTSFAAPFVSAYLLKALKLGFPIGAILDTAGDGAHSLLSLLPD